MKNWAIGKMLQIFGLRAGALFGGRFHITCRDKYGNIKWTEIARNLVVNEGLNALLNIMFHASTQITTWYVAIFESDTTPLATHTYASPGYTECTAYDEGTRPEYVEAAASGQSITNSANKAVFTFNATKTIYGAALVGGGSAPSTKGNTAGGGTLFCSCKFSSSKPVEDDDTLSVTYTLSASDDGA
jgi:hypothetical protein